MIFDREPVGETAILVHIDFSRYDGEHSDLPEFIELAKSAGAQVLEVVQGRRDVPDPKLLMGSGKVEELAAICAERKAELVLVNYALSPSQERNLEKQLKCRVLDRTGLILDIFAKRAHTHEGKLQVELAQLAHMATRLVRGWTHLERQRGGCIGLTGPGETQLELDKRLLKVRIKQIRQRLEKVRTQRALGRQSRKRSGLPTISLVGYTNAGKSTLFNQLTGADVLVKNQLFATLDPTLRHLELPRVGKVIVADTVGFIRNLPHGLVEAFRATLEETVEADLLLHVVDAHDPEHSEYIIQVMKVLAQIGAHEKPIIEVFNKIDRLEGVEPHVQRDEAGHIRRVWLSAQNLQGLELLQEALIEQLADKMVSGVLTLSGNYARLRAQLYEQHCVEQETILETGEWQLQVRAARHLLAKLCQEAQFACSLLG